MEQVSIFGLRGSGKSCYLYAMAEVMNSGVEISPNEKLTVTTPVLKQRIMLDKGFEMLAEGHWPQGSSETLVYDFDVKMNENGRFQSVMSFKMQDYRGGALNGATEEDEEERERLLKAFKNSTAIIFMVDGQSLSDVLPGSGASLSSIVKARHNISFIQDLFRLYVQRVGSENVVPILLAITKSDLLDDDKLMRAKSYLKDNLPEIFNNGSGVFVAITSVSIGENLRNDNGILQGRLVLNQRRNIHIPMLFPVYCFWSKQVDSGETDDNMERRMNILRRLFEYKIEFYYNGEPVIGM